MFAKFKLNHSVLTKWG